MKNILLIFVAILFAFTACDNEVDDIFDQSSQERINAAKVEYQKILTSAENGWHIEVIPGKEHMGGFNAYAIFKEDGMAYVATDFNPYNIESSIDSSLYEVTYTQGMTITFTTFSQMNYFSNPNNSYGAGKGGDVELLVKEISDDQIICEGKVNKGSYIFTKAKTKLHLDALDAVKDTEVAMIRKVYLSEYAFPVLKFDDGSKLSVTYNSLYRALIVTEYQNSPDGLKINENILRVKWDDQGMTFIDPLEYNGKTITRLDYIASEDAFKTPADQMAAEFTVDPWPPIEIDGIADDFMSNRYYAGSRYGGTLKEKMNDFREVFPDFVEIQMANDPWRAGFNIKFEPYYLPYAQFKDNKINKLSNDVVQFQFEKFVDRSFHVDIFKLEDRMSTPEGQALMDILFEEQGFKIFTTDYRYYYLISVNDPSSWMILFRA